MSARTLVTRLDSAGDVLLAGPAVRAVARSGASVTLLCSRKGLAAAQLLPDVSEILVFDAPWVHGDPPPLRARDLASLSWRLYRRRFDDAVILTSSFQSSLPMAMLLRAARVGRICGVSDDYPGSLLDVRVRVDDGLHEAERAAAIAQAAGYPADGEGPRIREDLPEVPGWAPGGPYVVLHPGAEVPARMWDPDLARDAVELMQREGHRVVVTGGPDERALTAHVAGAHGVDLGGRTTLAQLAGVLRGAQAVVVGNTGPAHLAAALGAPVVSLFSPVVPAHKWAPYTDRLLVLGDQYAACAQTRARECPVAGHPCLRSVGPRDVLAAVETLTRVVA
ncbi:MAG TPA: glycosyltransferase family 9 protein [Actinomycetota bacterium]|jgi:ADP-heptose:LPS heptosyltransferase|nr:glycosyltransferase family 9 protein [Actinomycetota bacterium]HNL51501.1 glycosyltransferase family 9 protein [Actinomycetota bacterium]